MNAFTRKFKPPNGISLIILTVIAGYLFISPQEEKAIKPAVLGDKAENQILYLSSPTIVSTESKFREEITTKTTILTFTTKYEDDQDSEIGILTTKQEGKDGKREEDTRTTYYDGVKYSSEVADVRITSATPKIILRGTKIILRDLDTPDGKITYKGKIHAWATSYNENCFGCNEWTATGARVRRGRSL